MHQESVFRAFFFSQQKKSHILSHILIEILGTQKIVFTICSETNEIFDGASSDGAKCFEAFGNERPFFSAFGPICHFGKLRYARFAALHPPRAPRGSRGRITRLFIERLCNTVSPRAKYSHLLIRLLSAWITSSH